MRPISNMNSVPAAERLSPMGAIEKIPSPGRPYCCSTLLAIKNAGAPMMVIVVPSEAANDSGISSFEGGMSRSRQRLAMTGNINAVVVK